MMKHALTALVSAILIVGPTTSTAMAKPVKTIEKIWYWYDNGNPDIVLGTTTFYCDETTSGTGFVTGEYYEVYYGC